MIIGLLETALMLSVVQHYTCSESLVFSVVCFENSFKLSPIVTMRPGVSAVKTPASKGFLCCKVL